MGVLGRVWQWELDVHHTKFMNKSTDYYQDLLECQLKATYNLLYPRKSLHNTPWPLLSMSITVLANDKSESEMPVPSGKVVTVSQRR